MTLEKQRTLQVQKLVYSYARAMMRVSQLTNDVFFLQPEESNLDGELCSELRTLNSGESLQ